DSSLCPAPRIIALTATISPAAAGRGGALPGRTLTAAPRCLAHPPLLPRDVPRDYPDRQRQDGSREREQPGEPPGDVLPAPVPAPRWPPADDGSCPPGRAQSGPQG